MRLAVFSRGQRVPTPVAALVVLASTAPALAGEAEEGPDFRAGSGELRFAAPYRAGRVPVVLVHGLLGSPANWSAMIEQLSADPTIRDRFQLLTLRYDSLRPIPDSGRNLLAALAEARRQLDPGGSNPAFERVVLVGHSLGGLFAKAATHSPDPRPLGPTNPPPIGAGQPAAPRVGRLIFIATPHRGSPVDQGAVRLAGCWLARVIGRSSGVGRSPLTSVDPLAWDHPLLEDLERARAADGAPFHSIIAARRDPTTDRATDGLMPVASARLGDARSEVVVPSDHFYLRHPDLVREVRRVLLEHAASLALPARVAASD